jgi:ribosome biogenesis GTPase
MLDVVTAEGLASPGRLASLRRLLASRARLDEYGD